MASPPRGRWSALRAAVATLCVAAPCAGQPAGAGVERPSAAQRVVRFFDFEERPMNQEPVPMFWVRAQHAPPERLRHGYPPWNAAAFDDAVRASGEWSVRLPTSGGSTSLRLSSGVLAAIPGADYRVAALVQTRGLRAAGARLIARFLDDRRDPIPGAEWATPVTRSEDAWTTVSVDMAGDFPGAAWIQLELQAIQPRQEARDRLGLTTEDLPPDPLDRPNMPRVRVWEEDVRGAAWFDDVIVYQMPRVTVSTQSPGNVVTAPERPVISARIRDLTGEPLSVRVTLRDWTGRTAAEWSAASAPGGSRLSWTPDLPGYGWWRVTVDVANAEAVVARLESSLAWLPPGPASAPAEAARFGLIAESLPPARLRAVPDVARSMGVGFAQVSAWTRETTRGGVRGDVRALADVVERLIAGGVGVSMTLDAIPDELSLALRADPGDLLPVLASAPEGEGPAVWSPYLDDFLNQFGQRVRRWQIGATGGVSAFWSPDLRSQLDSVHAAFARLVPRPALATPWDVEHSVDDRVAPGRTLTALLGAGTPLSAVGSAIEPFVAHGESTIVLEPVDESTFGARAAAIDLVKRAAWAWRAGAPRLAVRAPWVLPPAGDPQPRATLAAWRQVTERFAGRRIVGEMPVTAGVRALILDGAGGGALLAWNESAAPGDARIGMFLGSGDIAAVDLFGNATPVPLVEGAHDVALTDAPVFVEGVNVPLARFRAGFRVEPAFLPAEATLHAMELELANPWPVSISGALRVVEPTGWKIEPRALRFDVPAGQTVRLPVDVWFGLGEEAGTKRVVVEADVLADQLYGRTRLSAPLEIGLNTTQLTPSYAIVRNAAGEWADVAVTVSITNNGEESATLRTFALAPGFPREEAPVSGLQPGQTAVRRFLFQGGASSLLGKRVRVGLVDVDGAGRLNKSLVIQ